MKLTVTKDKLNSNPIEFLRRAGYAHVQDRLATQESFSIRIGREHYPRLHMYYSETGDQVTFNLHLDQKRNSYEGSSRHNAEYDGELVEREINRLRDLLGMSTERGSSVQSKTQARPTSAPDHKSIVHSNIGSGSLISKMSASHKADLLDFDDVEETKKSWWEFWK